MTAAALRRPTAAVVGSGVAGLTAAYLLQRTHDVTLFEADDRLGGHAHTHDIPTPDGRVVPVDTGFIVHNERTYPNLLRLFGELDVATQPTEMSMSITCEGCGLEYAGARGLAGLFAQPRRAGDPAYLRMLAEVRRFHAHARRLLDHADAAPGRRRRLTLRHVPRPRRLLRLLRPALHDPGRLVRLVAGHRRRAAVPGRATCSGSSTTTGCSRSPARPQWRTVVGGSRSYVERRPRACGAVQTGAGIAR